VSGALQVTKISLHSSMMIDSISHLYFIYHMCVHTEHTVNHGHKKSKFQHGLQCIMLPHIHMNTVDHGSHM